MFSIIIVFVIFPLILYYLYIQYVSFTITGIQEVEASPVLQGQRTPTPPREAFYSKSITSTHLRQISDCKRTVEMSTTRKTENPLPRRVPTHVHRKKNRCPYTQTTILQAPHALAPGLARTADLHLQGAAFMALPLYHKTYRGERQ